MSQGYFQTRLAVLDEIMREFALTAEECVNSSFPEDLKKEVFAELQKQIVNCGEQMDIITKMMQAKENNKALKEELSVVANRRAERLQLEEQ